MQALLQHDGSLLLKGADETRIIPPGHPSHQALMKLYTQAADVALSAASAPSVFNPPATVAKAEPEYVPPPGCGGHPWMGGTPEPLKVYEVPVEALHVDPARFQFRASTDNPLAEQEFDPSLAGSLAVWKDAGLTYVVNGHRRFQLLLAKGSPADVPTLACRYLTDAKSADEARSVGALLNIAGGTATALDTATFLHGAGRSIADLGGANINLDKQMTTDTAPLLDLLKTSEKRNAARKRAAAIEVAAREREAILRQRVESDRQRGAETPRSGQTGDASLRRAEGGRRLSLTDLPAGWTISPSGKQLGLFRDGRDTPVAEAATADELVRRIHGAGKGGFLPIQLSACHTEGPIHMRLAGAERGIEIMQDGQVAMFLPIVAGGDVERVHKSAIKCLNSIRKKAAQGAIVKPRPEANPGKGDKAVALSASDIVARVSPAEISKEVRAEALLALRLMFPFDAK